MEHFYRTEYLESSLFDEEELALAESLEDEDADADGLSPDEIPDQEEFERLPALELTLDFEDGTQRTFRLAAVFLANEQEYAALMPVEDEKEEEVLLMRMFPGENDELRLAPVEESEWDTVRQAFRYQLLDDDTQNWKKENEEDGD
ncbi:MAG: DUF1292 domain-containing protein [Clostridiales bacterium]|nr:DUF1292 domain-containing protein [Clostridiales bacterium]